MSDAPSEEDDSGAYHDDGAAYVDAATVALRYSSVELGPAPSSLKVGDRSPRDRSPAARHDGVAGHRRGA